VCSEIWRESTHLKELQLRLENLRGELEDVGELAIVGREGVLATEIHGGNGVSGGVGRVHGVLLRRKKGTRSRR